MLSNHVKMNRYLHWRSDDITDLGNMVLITRHHGLHTKLDSELLAVLFALYVWPHQSVIGIETSLALRGCSWIPINPNLVFFSLTQYVVPTYLPTVPLVKGTATNLGLSVLLYLISGLCQLQRLKLLAWTRNFFGGCFSNYKLDKIYRCQGQKSQQLGSTSSFTIIWGQSSLRGKGLPLPKMWLSLSPKYQYTEQINFWIKEMFLAVIYIQKHYY